MEELLWALLALSNVVLDEGTSWATAVEFNERCSISSYYNIL